MLAGRQVGVETYDITLYPIGGCANMDVPVEPKKEIFVALAGPAVNMALALPLYFVSGSCELFNEMFIVNIALMVFNLLPAFPMDGGRVLRAILCWFLHDKMKSTVIAARVSQTLCVAGLIVAMCFGLINLGIISVMIGVIAQVEINRMRETEKQNPRTELEEGARLYVEASRDFERLARDMAEFRRRHGPGE